MRTRVECPKVCASCFSLFLMDTEFNYGCEIDNTVVEETYTTTCENWKDGVN